MKTYVLKVAIGAEEPSTAELDWNEETFERYQNEQLSEAENEDLTNLAIDTASVYYWVEEIDKD
ncbi:hypothetical protein [Capnocytophaga canis]|uniref:hypothetical protein n=1 Tax=Capnocytophaga canis TaxID=1848903 RepID=UPI0015626780|nr:hypothetical protein [Capnocytophaga canis]